MCFGFPVALPARFVDETRSTTGVVGLKSSESIHISAHPPNSRKDSTMSGLKLLRVHPRITLLRWITVNHTPNFEFCLQDDDDIAEATGDRAEEASKVLPRTNKRAVIEDSSDEE